jgi:hypothetical protein
VVGLAFCPMLNANFLINPKNILMLTTFFVFALGQ